MPFRSRMCDKSKPAGPPPTIATWVRMVAIAPESLLRHPRLDRVLDVLDLIELDVDELTIHTLDAPNVDRLDRVSRFWVDRHRAPRAFPGHALGGGNQLFGVGVAVCLLQRFVDHMHAVVGADREHVGV